MSKKGVVIDLTKKDAGEEEKDEDAVEDNEVPLFNMFAQIVGKQFYKGRMNDGEMIFLEREPRNQYDPNAIRVDSIVHQQVGHISAKGISIRFVYLMLDPNSCDQMELRMH